MANDLPLLNFAGTLHYSALGGYANPFEKGIIYFGSYIAFPYMQRYVCIYWIQSYKPTMSLQPLI